MASREAIAIAWRLKEEAANEYGNAIDRLGALVDQDADEEHILQATDDAREAGRRFEAAHGSWAELRYGTQ